MGEQVTGYTAIVSRGLIAADRKDLLVGERGQIRQRALAHAWAFTVGLAQQIRRTRTAIGDRVDVHDHIVPRCVQKYKPSAMTTPCHIGFAINLLNHLSFSPETLPKSGGTSA